MTALVRAHIDGWCWACNEAIHKGAAIVLRHGDWIHPHCAPGGSDE